MAGVAPLPTWRRRCLKAVSGSFLCSPSVARRMDRRARCDDPSPAGLLLSGRRWRCRSPSASRAARGRSRRADVPGACRPGRSVSVLILLGVFRCRSTRRARRRGGRSKALNADRAAVTACLFLLQVAGPHAVSWIAFALAAVCRLLGGVRRCIRSPGAPGSTLPPSVGVPTDCGAEVLIGGFAAHWNKNSNLAWAFDTWFLNLFERGNLFLFNGGGYATHEFHSYPGRDDLGPVRRHLARRHARRAKSTPRHHAGVASLLLGAALGWAGICRSSSGSG